MCQREGSPKKSVSNFYMLAILFFDRVWIPPSLFYFFNRLFDFFKNLLATAVSREAEFFDKHF